MPKSPATHASAPGKELDTFKRRLAILQCLKRGVGRSVRELMQQLAMQQIQASERSVQRDLLILSARHGYPIESDGQNPARWTWRAQAEDISLPGTDPATALALIMLQKHAKNLLPPDALQALAPKFAAAEKALGQHTDNAKTRWADRIAVIHRALQLIPPPIAPAVREAVFTALATNTQVHVHYRKAYDGELKQYPLHPQALVVREGIIYLIATARDYTEPRQFALHRMQKAKLLDTPARRLPDFDLETYIREGGMALDVGEEIKLELDLAESAGYHLTELKLSPDQTCEKRLAENGTMYYHITATVRDSMQLRWWLDSFGDEVVQTNRSMASEHN